MPRVPRSKAQKVYLGAGSSQELISDRACLLKKVHLVSDVFFLCLISNDLNYSIPFKTTQFELDSKVVLLVYTLKS